MREIHNIKNEINEGIEEKWDCQITKFEVNLTI